MPLVATSGSATRADRSIEECRYWKKWHHQRLLSDHGFHDLSLATTPRHWQVFRPRPGDFIDRPEKTGPGPGLGAQGWGNFLQFCVPPNHGYRQLVHSTYKPSGWWNGPLSSLSIPRWTPSRIVPSADQCRKFHPSVRYFLSTRASIWL